jgi:hypothetical protein
MKLFLYIIAIMGYLLTAAEGFSFGIQGQHGVSGINGKSGSNARALTIHTTGQRISFDSVGKNGEDGTVGMPGRDAYQCRQPYRPRKDIKGANGGSAGNGGNAGNGGKGGSALIFYNSLSELSKLTLVNNGGIGGIGGKGGDYGGYACTCEERSWQYSTCEWKLEKKFIDDPSRGNWQKTWRTKTTDCTQRRRPPIRVPNDDLYKYKWKLNKERSKTYYCEDGFQGYSGTYGDNGKDGSYGKVTLVKGKSIPTDSSVYQARLSESLSKFYELSKNVFVKKTGLQSLIASESNTSDDYIEFVKKDKKKFGIAWRLPNGPAYYGLQDSLIKITLEQGKGESTRFNLEFPGEPIYEVHKLDSTHWQIKITGLKGQVNPPRKIPNKCSAKNGKGANLCEFSGYCIYEVGICKPR